LSRWLEKEMEKDQNEILQHKKKLINQIKKEGVTGIMSKPKPKKQNGVWKKIKKFLGI
jgi:hypothetical protein